MCWQIEQSNSETAGTYAPYTVSIAKKLPSNSGPCIKGEKTHKQSKGEVCDNIGQCNPYAYKLPDVARA